MLVKYHNLPENESLLCKLQLRQLKYANRGVVSKISVKLQIMDMLLILHQKQEYYIYIKGNMACNEYTYINIEIAESHKSNDDLYIN